MTEPRLTLVALPVTDVDRAARFYRDAFGVSVQGGDTTVRRADSSAPEPGGLRLTLSPAAEPRPAARIGFLVDDLSAAHARAVGAGAVLVEEPRAEPWGRTAAYLDPDGNVVSLSERSRPVRVAGVDIAGGAWAVVVLEGNRVVETFRCETFADALLVDAWVVAVDIPIGMPASGARPADVAARRFVGGRGSSVFTISWSMRVTVFSSSCSYGVSAASS